MEALPNELLLDILRRLPPLDRLRLGRTCRSWDLVITSSWKTQRSLRLQEFLDFLDNKAEDCLGALLGRCGASLLSFTYSGKGRSGYQIVRRPEMPPLTEAMAAIIADSCPRLREITVEYAEVERESLVHFSRLRRLRSATFVRCFNDDSFDRSVSQFYSYNRPRTPDAELQYFLNSSTHLETLNLAGNDILGDCFRSLSLSVTNLCLDRCETLGYAGLGLVVQSCPNLLRLSMNHMATHEPCLSITCIAGLHHLSHLQLRNYFGLSSLADILAAAPFAAVLRSLDLQHSNQVNNETLAQIGARCHNLRRLEIGCHYGIQANVSLAALRNLKLLEIVDLSWLQHLTDSDLQALTPSTSLRRLKAHCLERVSREGILATVAAHSKLLYLDWTMGDQNPDPDQFLRQLESVLIGQQRKMTLKVSFLTSFKSDMLVVELDV